MQSMSLAGVLAARCLGSRTLLAGFVAGLAIVLFALPSDVGAQTTPSWAYPAGTKTGVAPVDAAIAAVLARDAASLSKQYVFVDRACTEPQGLGAIPCPAGKPVGTPVSVFSTSQCETAYHTKDAADLGDAASSFLSDQRFLFAVAKASGQPQGAKYILFFGAASDSGAADVQGIDAAGRAVYVNDDGIIGLNYGCRDGVGHLAAAIPNSGFLLSATANTAPGAPTVGSGVQGPSRSPLLLSGAGLLVLSLAIYGVSRRRS